MMQGHRLVGSAQPVGWDQRRFAAPAHHDFSMFPTWWAGARSELVPPYVKKAMALAGVPVLRFTSSLPIDSTACEHSALAAFEAHSDLAAVRRSDERLPAGTN